MKRLTMWGGLAGAMLAVVGGVAIVGHRAGWFQLPGLKTAASANAIGKDGKKPDVPLEFLAQEVVQPRLMRMPTFLELSGPLVAPETAVLRAKVGGTLVSLAVAEGSRVKAGQAIARIDMAEAASRVLERDAMLASARASLEQAKRTHESNERLAQQNFISPIALENSRAGLDTARANLNAAQASLQTTRVGLRDAQLTAPFAGIVAKRHVQAGEKVSPEQAVVTVVNLLTLELAGNVGTHEVGRLAPGMPVQVQVEGVDSGITGRIARIAPAAEAGTRAIGVAITLPNADEKLRAGQYAIARVTLADATERLTLPVSAVGNASGQDHVWVLENGALARRSVALGRRDERNGVVELLQGASTSVGPNSQVLGARFDNLREGAKASIVAVRALAPAASAAAGAASASR
jgi:membrane fusion protein, multidrug efflux system